MTPNYCGVNKRSVEEGGILIGVLFLVAIVLIALRDRDSLDYDDYDEDGPEVVIEDDDKIIHTKMASKLFVDKTEN